MSIILNWIKIFYYHVEKGERCIVRAKAILQSNSTSNNTDKTENKMKSTKVKKIKKNHPSLHAKTSNIVLFENW